MKRGLLLLLVLTTFAACTSGDERRDDPDRSVPPTSSPGVTATPDGLSYDPSTATLTWEPVPGAKQYYVSAQAEGSSPWIWIGSETSVRYGELGGEATLDMTDEPALAPEEGRTYTWFVTSLDDSGEIIDVSDPQTFEP